MIGPKTVIWHQRFTDTPDGMGGFTRVWANKQTIKGVLSPQNGNKQRLRDGIAVQVSHRFFFPRTSVMPIERDRFQSLDGTHTYEILFIDRPLTHYQMIIAELMEYERPASST